MSPKPPFAFLETRSRSRWLITAMVLALAMTAFFTVVGRPLTTDVAGSGIISFEFAGSLENAQAILASWDNRTKMVAAFSLGLDFLYPLVYASAISLGCVRGADRVGLNRPQVAAAGYWLAWGAWLAALLDYIENMALLLLLFGSTAAVWPPLAFMCAAVKFILVIAAIFYTLAAWLLFRPGT